MPTKRPDVYRNLSTLLMAGIPLERSLLSASRSATGPLRRAFGAVNEAIGQGQGLSEAMAAQGRCFPRLDVVVAGVGETSGGLGEAFGELASYYTMRQRLGTRLRMGLILPALLLHVGVVLGAFPMWILGGITGGQYVLIVLTVWAVFWAPVLAIWAAVRFGPGGGLVRRVLDGIALGVPVLGRAVSRDALARFFKAFHLLYGGGVPIAQAVRQSAMACGNEVYARRFLGAADSADAGNPAWHGLSPSLPGQIRDAWEVGEESGELDRVAQRLSASMEAESEYWYGQFMAWMPRVLYILVAIYLVFQILQAASYLFGAVWSVVQ